MAFFRPGDIVQITSDAVKAAHPNWKRPLQVGDKLLIEKVKRSERDSYSRYVKLCYLTQSGEECWIDGSCCRIAYKGGKEDCVAFLKKHGLAPAPSKKEDGKFWWADLARNGNVGNKGFLPHHLHRHLKYDNEDQKFVSDYKVLYIYYNSMEEALKAAHMAWLRMTPAQQSFYSNVHSLHEIFP